MRSGPPDLPKAPFAIIVSISAVVGIFTESSPLRQRTPTPRTVLDGGNGKRICFDRDCTHLLAVDTEELRFSTNDQFVPENLAAKPKTGGNLLDTEVTDSNVLFKKQLAAI